MDSDLLKKESTRQFRVIDLMITAHCILKERFLRKANALDITILIFSSLLVATVFIDSKVIAFISTDENLTKIIIGLLSILVFILTIIQFKVDWKQRSDQHQKAYEALIKLKPVFRNMKNNNALTMQEYNNVMDEFKLISAFICTIPERDFVKLKCQHQKKIVLSKLASRNPAASIRILKIYLFFKGNTKKIRALKIE